MKFYQTNISGNAAAVYEERMDWDNDGLSQEYEAWAQTGIGIERIYVKKNWLAAFCHPVLEEDVTRFAPALIETLHLARPDEIRPAKASPRYTCEHGESCSLSEHSQANLWRDAQHEASKSYVEKIRKEAASLKEAKESPEMNLMDLDDTMKFHVMQALWNYATDKVVDELTQYRISMMALCLEKDLQEER